MKKTITIEKALIIVSILAAAKLSKLEGSQKFPVVRAYTSLRPFVDAYASTEKDTQERLRPDNWDKLVAEETAEKWKELTDEERLAHNSAVRKYQVEIDECLAAEREKEVEVEIEPVADDVMTRVLDSNPDWTIRDISNLKEFFSE